MEGQERIFNSHFAIYSLGTLDESLLCPKPQFQQKPGGWTKSVILISPSLILNGPGTPSPHRPGRAAQKTRH